MPSNVAKGDRPPVPLNHKIALTIQEVADSISVSYKLVDLAILRGELPAVTAGPSTRSKRVLRDDVVDWLRSKPWEPAA